MILLIDGYNLLKNINSKDYISEQVINEFVNRLNDYSKRKNHKVVIVFDGGEFSFPTKKSTGRVVIIYSGYKESADDVIKNYLSDAKNNVLLISSDRELQKFASKFNLQYISALEFYNILNRKEERYHKIKGNNVLHKTTEQIDPELDKIMAEIVNVDIKKDNDIIYNKKNKNSNKLSKEKIKLKQKIKKL